MLENRKILTAVLGYIIGIIMGLYCKINIAYFYIILFIIHLKINKKRTKKQFKLISVRRYKRYLKIIFNQKVIKIIIIFSIIGNTVVLFKNHTYENLYKKSEGKSCQWTGIVISKQDEKYKIKIVTPEYKNTYLYLYTKQDTELKYGDKIVFNGIYTSPTKRSNYRGFDYSSYLKTLKIYGIIKSEKVKVVEKNAGNIFIQTINKISLKLQSKIDISNLSYNQKAILKGILFGNTTEISKDFLNQFSESSIIHILSVSGMHISYIIILSNFIFNICIGRHNTKIITSIIIFIYICIANFVPSVVRAGITGIIWTLSNFFYRKSDIWQNIGLALFIILLDNPFLIQNIGLQLSFAGTIGIIIFQKNLKGLIEDYLERENRKSIRKNKKYVKKIIKIFQSKLAKSILDVTIVTISATLMIIPILLINYNCIQFTSLFISIVSSFIIGPIMIFGFIFIFIKISIVENILEFLLNLLINMAKIGSNLPLHQIYFTSPNFIQIIFYYTLILGLNLMLKIKLEKQPNMIQKRIKNLISLFRYKIKSNKSKIIVIFCIISLLYYFISIISKNLKIHVLDVGQGDCTLIITPQNQTILIDGGGNELSDFDVRRKNINAIFF